MAQDLSSVFSAKHLVEATYTKSSFLKANCIWKPTQTHILSHTQIGLFSYSLKTAFEGTKLGVDMEERKFPQDSPSAFFQIEKY